MIDVHYASLTSEGVQHRKNEQMITYPEITRPTMNGREPVFPVGDSRPQGLSSPLPKGGVGG